MQHGHGNTNTALGHRLRGMQARGEVVCELGDQPLEYATLAYLALRVGPDRLAASAHPSPAPAACNAPL
jgi:hypothetical protein